jgi:hypothetical protein
MLYLNNIKDLSKITSEYIYVIYENEIIIEVDEIENKVYFQNVEEGMDFEAIDLNNIVIYNIVSESYLEKDLRKIIKQLEQMKKSLFDLENGKDCTILVRNESEILREEEIEELFTYYILEENIAKIRIYKLKRI